MTNINPRLKALADRLKTDLPSENVPIIVAEKEETRVQPPTVNVRSNADAWSISGVEYRNGVYTVDLAKSLLDGRNSRQQAEWIDYSQEAIAKGEFYTPDYPLFYGIVRALFRAKDEPAKLQEAEEAKKFLQDTSRARWLMTLTRIKYQPQVNLLKRAIYGVEDIIVHNYGMSDSYEEKTNFIGADGFIKDVASPASCKALLGTDNITEINNLAHWLNETDAYLWRVNSKPENVDERVAWLSAYSGWVVLGCGGSLSGAVASLGVRPSRAKISEEK